MQKRYTEYQSTRFVKNRNKLPEDESLVVNSEDLDQGIQNYRQNTPLSDEDRNSLKEILDS